MISNEGVFSPKITDFGFTLSKRTTPTPIQKLSSKMVYAQCIDNIKSDPVSQSSLKRNYNISDEDCSHVFILPFKTTLDSKLRWFQFKIVNSILPLND